MTFVGDHLFPPGTPVEASFHYYCPGDGCRKSELTDMEIVQESSRSYCRSHRLRYVACGQSPCHGLGIRHRLPTSP